MGRLQQQGDNGLEKEESAPFWKLPSDAVVAAVDGDALDLDASVDHHASHHRAVLMHVAVAVVETACCENAFLP